MEQEGRDGWFVDQVIKLIIPPEIEPDPDIVYTIQGLYKAGWSLADAVAYCSCFEEISPELDEDTAINRMAILRAKYDGRS